jgi:hypothetical protein
MLSLATRRYGSAVAAVLLMSVSHPFTGIQLILVCITWALAERIVFRNRDVPLWFPGVIALVGLLHVGYYIFFLDRFAEHRALHEQWTLASILGFKVFVLSVILVAIPATMRFATKDRARQTLSDPANRLLIMWFLVSLALAKHELVLSRPVQPLHFTRGYQWIPLFLLGLPVMLAFWARVRAQRSRPVSLIVALAVFAVMLSDNLTWFGVRTAQAMGRGFPSMGLAAPYLGMRLENPGMDLLAWLNRSENLHSVVASQDDSVGYLVTVYTPLRSWQSHYYNTPFTDQRHAELHAFFDNGRPPAIWQRLPMLIVFRAGSDWRKSAAAFEPARVSLAWQNSSYVVLRVRPSTGSAAAAARIVGSGGSTADP